MYLTNFEKKSWNDTLEMLFKMPMKDNNDESIIEAFVRESLDTRVDKISIPFFLENYSIYDHISEEELFTKFQNDPSFVRRVRVFLPTEVIKAYQEDIANKIARMANGQFEYYLYQEAYNGNNGQIKSFHFDVHIPINFTPDKNPVSIEVSINDIDHYVDLDDNSCCHIL
ncbi:MAG: hypothetical protein VX777_06530 [Chlamydiota bacterium]|nr:hypothetical protein [Chlamydiota bacterium]